MTPWGFCPTESQCLTGGPDSHGHTLGRLSRRVRPATGPGPPESALLVWGGVLGGLGAPRCWAPPQKDEVRISEAQALVLYEAPRQLPVAG